MSRSMMFASVCNAPFHKIRKKNHYHLKGVNHGQ